VGQKFRATSVLICQAILLTGFDLDDIIMEVCEEPCMDVFMVAKKEREQMKCPAVEDPLVTACWAMQWYTIQSCSNVFWKREK
jgi:hypothetical protein